MFSAAKALKPAARIALERFTSQIIVTIAFPDVVFTPATRPISWIRPSRLRFVFTVKETDTSLVATTSTEISHFRID